MSGFPHPPRRDPPGHDTLEGLNDTRVWMVKQRLGGWMNAEVFQSTLQALDRREAKVRARLQASQT
jgi:hypothetical protein